MPLNQVLSAIDNSNFDKDDILEKENESGKKEIQDFLDKIKGDKSISAEIARGKIDNLKDKVEINLNILKGTIIAYSTDFRNNKEIQDKYKGEAAFKNNNPAGLSRNKGMAKRLKDLGVNFSEGTERGKGEGGKYFKFDTVGDGLMAQKVFWNSKTYSTIGNRLDSWAVNNYTDNLIKDANSTGENALDKNTEVKKISEDDLNLILALQIQHENKGYYKELKNRGILPGNIETSILNKIGGYDSGEKFLYDSENQVKNMLGMETVKSVGGFGQTSILNVVTWGGGALSIFKAAMGLFNGNIGEAIKAATFGYFAFKNMDYVFNGDIKSFEDKMDSLVNDAVDKGDVEGGHLRGILEKINTGENGNKRSKNGEFESSTLQKYYSNLFPEKKEDRIKYQDEIKEVFGGLNFEEIHKVKGDISESNSGEIFSKLKLNSLSSELKIKIFNLLNLIKKDGIKNNNEFIAVNEYVVFNFRPNIVKDIFKMMGKI